MAMKRHRQPGIQAVVENHPRGTRRRAVEAGLRVQDRNFLDFGSGPNAFCHPRGQRRRRGGDEQGSEEPTNSAAFPS